MKVTDLGRVFPVAGATDLGASGGGIGGSDPNFPNNGGVPPSGQIPTATGSNTWAWGSNIAMLTANGSNQIQGPFANFASGSGISFAVASNTLTISATGSGGGSAVIEHGTMGATETFDASAGEWHTGTLDTDLTATVTGFTNDVGAVMNIGITQDGTGGHAITWDPDVVFSGDDQPDQTASSMTWFVLWSVEGDSTVYGAKVGSGSSASPLTTKGDIWAYSTTDDRFAVGSNGTTIVANSAQTFGMQWSNVAIAGELLMQDGVTSPPVPIETEDGSDWLYADLI